MRCSLQQVFAEHFDAYARQHALHPRELRAAHCIRGCYTPAMGAHLLACPHGHVRQVQPHACRHRSCPRCAEPARARWIDAQLERLLPCPHFHVIFTLPHELLPLWSFNRGALAQLLFDCARQSLLELLADPRHLGALPGILLSLHTWGRTLSQHPHLHCLVSAGGIDPAQHWRAARGRWLLPLKPLQALFRGKLLAGLGARLQGRQLALPPLQDFDHWRSIVRTLYRRHWNIQLCPPYESGRSVALYLARYVKGGPLPRSRALECSPERVSFGYTDHRDGQPKTLSLSPHDFIARILWHAAPRGQHTTRHAGLYASAHLQHHRACAAALASPARPWPRPAALPPPTIPARCPVCALPLIRQLHTRAHRWGEFSGAASPRPPAITAAPGPTLRSNGRPRASPGAAA